MIMVPEIGKTLMHDKDPAVIHTRTDKEMKRRIARYVIFLLISLLIATASYWAARKYVISGWDYNDAWIVSLENYRQLDDLEKETLSDPEWRTIKYTLILTFHTGEQKGNTFPVQVEHLKDSRLSLSRGKEYILSVDRFEDGHEMFSINDSFRFPMVIAFISGFASILCLGAGISGTRALAGLVLSLFLLGKWSLPTILSGTSPLLVAILSTGGIAGLTVMLVMRKVRYWPAAIFGSLGGAVAASTIGWAAVSLWNLAGVAAEGGNILASSFPGMNMQGILLASVIIGAIGAVLDVSISITSAMGELHEYDPEIGTLRLMRTGLNVGRDILGSMINTLILAYFGSSLIISLLIADSQPVLWSVLNDPTIAAEILRGIAGTAGLLLTVPVTAAGGALWLVKAGRRNRG